MIIGRGQIATSFNNTDLEDYIIFASGVSDSNCTNNDIFLREYNLIMQVLEDNPKKLLFILVVAHYLLKTMNLMSITCIKCIWKK